MSNPKFSLPMANLINTSSSNGTHDIRLRVMPDNFKSPNRPRLPKKIRNSCLFAFQDEYSPWTSRTLVLVVFRAHQSPSLEEFILSAPMLPKAALLLSLGLGTKTQA